MFEIPNWPYFTGAPGAEGLVRSCPEDFVVEEIPRVLPSGEGNHRWLWIEKRSANTDWIARELAKASGCLQRDVGYAGLKDRHAVTRQWFSIPANAATDQRLEETRIEGAKILEVHRHERKLKRGTLNGNRFNLKIRQFNGSQAKTEQCINQIRSNGVPNYFGPQRFGHGGKNVAEGFSLLVKRVRLPRSKTSIYLSAIRSFLFNQVLAQRVERADWNTIIDGELAMLNGTQSIFRCDKTDANIEDRCRRLDIHPTGPLPGAGGTQPGGEVAQMEHAVLRNWPELTELLIAQRLQASRRSLRLCPAELESDIVGGTLELSFVLPPGAYATTVLREILVDKGAQ